MAADSGGRARPGREHLGREHLGRDRGGRVRAPVLDRLRAGGQVAGRAGWAWPLGVTLLAFLLRLLHLGRPNLVAFDETYYAKDAYSLLQHGYVQDFVDDADQRIIQGDLDGIMTGEPSQVVHPEGGKWMIALGEQLFGMDPFGWRFASAVAGALLVLVVARIVLRLTASVPLACVAGLLLTFDGLHFVMSRLALLDIFVAAWTMAGVACLLADRDRARHRLADLVEAMPGWYPGARIAGFGPVRGLLWRPWRIAAGVSFGLAASCKWSVLYVVAVLGLLTWAWDVGMRRAIGVRGATWRSALVDGVPAFAAVVLVGLVVYLSTWTGWLLHHELYEARFGFGYGDNPAWGAYLDDPAEGGPAEVLQAFRSLWAYHQMVYDFHTGDYLAGQTHVYGSNPHGWLLMHRPVGIDAQLDLPVGVSGCPEGDDTCLRQVLALGSPAVWWPAAAALVASVWQWVGRRDWRFALPVLGTAATWLPWFQYDDRPIFFFYAIAILPFTVIGLTLVLGRLVAIADASPLLAVRRGGVVAVGAYVAAVVLTFAYFYPLWSDAVITNEAWNDRIWFSSWI